MLLEVLDSSGVSSKVEQTWLYSGYATVTSYRSHHSPKAPGLDAALADVPGLRRCLVGSCRC